MNVKRIRRLLGLVVATAVVGVVGYYGIVGLDAFNNKVRRALKHAPEVVLYSLDPFPYELKDGEFVPLADDVPKFDRYRILGQTALLPGETRAAAVDAVIEAVDTVARRKTKSVGACFNPRHGIRATDASGTYDLVICFQCKQMYVHFPNGRKRNVLIAGSGDVLNRILQSAKVPPANELIRGGEPS